MSRTAVGVIAVLALLGAVVVSALPVSKRRADAITASQAEAAIEAAEEANAARFAESDAEAVQPNAAAPLLEASFHVKYSIYAINHQSTLLPSLANLIDRASKMLDGEAWQNVAADGAVTIKTVTKPTLLGRILTGAMTQVWVKDHGWTLKGNGKCTADAVNTQLVIPATILRDSGVFKGTLDLKPITKIVANKYAKPAKNGSYKVDQWDATLPNGEGSVTYYLYSHTKTPFMSRYALTGKPAVWAQYNEFTPKPDGNAASEYAPVAACAKAAEAGAKTPASTTLAKIDQLAAAAHKPGKKPQRKL